MSTTELRIDYRFASIERKEPGWTIVQRKHFELLARFVDEPTFVHYSHEDDGKLAKGFSASLPRTTAMQPIANLDPQPFSSRWFGTVAGLPIYRRDIEEGVTASETSSEAMARLGRLHSEGLIEQWNNFSSEKAQRIVQHGVDSVSWHAGLDGHGHFVAVEKASKRTHHESEPLYWLVVHCDAGTVGRALSESAKSFTGSIGEFKDSQAYIRTRAFVRRNVERLLAGAIAVLGLRRDTLGVVPDMQAMLPSDQPHAAPPDICTSERLVCSHYNLFGPHPLKPSSVVYYCAVTPLFQAGNHVLLLRNPTAGVLLVGLSADFDYVCMKPADNKVPHADTPLNVHAGIPIGLGRRPDASELRSLQSSDLHSRIAALNLPKNTFFWVGFKSGLEFANWRLAAYRNDEATKVRLRLLLGEHSKVVSLKPVVVYLAS